MGVSLAGGWLYNFFSKNFNLTSLSSRLGPCDLSYNSSLTSKNGFNVEGKNPKLKHVFILYWVVVKSKYKRVHVYNFFFQKYQFDFVVVAFKFRSVQLRNRRHRRLYLDFIYTKWIHVFNLGFFFNIEAKPNINRTDPNMTMTKSNWNFLKKKSYTLFYLKLKSKKKTYTQF